MEAGARSFEKNLVRALGRRGQRRTGSLRRLYNGSFVDRHNLTLARYSGRRKAKDKDLGMPRLPAMKIHTAEATNCLAAYVALGINKPKKLLRFGWRKKRRIEEFGDPVHFMSIGQIECDLNVFI